jgi:hypothetical protein
MQCAKRSREFDPLPGRSGRPEDEVVEIPVLMPGWQAAALEQAARDHGMTTGQMVRRLIRDFCRSEDRFQDFSCFSQGNNDSAKPCPGV